jgi:hypothetical protein
VIDPDIGVIDPRKMVGTRKLDIPRPRDVSAEVTPAGDIDPLVVGSVHHKRRHADSRQDMPDVDLAIHACNRHGCRRAGGKALVPGYPLAEGSIVGQTWGDKIQNASAAPGAIDILQHGLKLLLCRTPGRQLIHWRE